MIGDGFDDLLPGAFGRTRPTLGQSALDAAARAVDGRPVDPTSAGSATAAGEPIPVQTPTAGSITPPIEAEQAASQFPLFGCPTGPGEARAWGIIGRVSGQPVRLDLQYPKTLAIFGQIRSGKSYLAGVLTEMSAIRIPGVNLMPRLESAVVIFNYRASSETRFEYGTYSLPNDDPSDIAALTAQFGASPIALSARNLQVCAYEREIDARRGGDYAGMQTFPLLFRPGDLQDADWMLLMGLPDPDNVYIQVMRNIVEDLGYANALSVDAIRSRVQNSADLSAGQKHLASLRLDFASRYLSTSRGLDWAQVVRPGTITVIDLRRRQGNANDALRLCLVVLSATRTLSADLHKFVLFDEFHEYYDQSFSMQLDGVARMVGHHNMTLCLATQNTHKVDRDMLRSFANKLVFKVDSPTMNDLISADERLEAVSHRDVLGLRREHGECIALFDDCTDGRYGGVPVRLQVRPRVTRHGGTTAGQG